MFLFKTRNIGLGQRNEGSPNRGALNHSDGDLTSLDVVTSKFVITVTQIDILYADYAHECYLLRTAN